MAGVGGAPCGVSVDGWDRADEEETRADPRTRRQLERMRMVFRTTLLMCIAGQPQFAHLHITKDALDEWYDWLYGEDIVGRRPPPSDRVHHIAERNAWRKIHDLVHSGFGRGRCMSTATTLPSPL